VDYYRALRAEIAERIERGLGPVTPDGDIERERFRVVVEGPPNWTSFRQFWKMFSDEGAVAVASTYTKVGGVYDLGFRHDPSRPLETLAEYCLGCYTNLGLPTRIKLLARYVEEYGADGFLINSVKSCNSFSAGQLHIMREVERLSGRPGGFIESDLVDPRYFSAANIKNRLESYFQMLEQKRLGGAA
jgi:benzoyl-CoA reductase subunit B